ncbi:hypothetical protein GNP81_14660 [Aliivibrio fischeri]|uniref:hypothetical protein n=1 Tax=Aliivibrio fischeri TaxID=668 RepID=UPI0012D9C2F5|nr:hypothetical protein [Aliivibrio fischeri]MUK61782.1 hypothetical protein [Aliivibrio fischeri]MUL21947.1 hypothetical protein [Aliivibrio fischeri]MUL25838.1 hypothetical protein [Aliivibrio fischeri]
MKITLPDEKYGNGNDYAVSGEGTPVCQTEVFDVDDTYIVFSDSKITIEDFVKETYLSDKSEVIEHFIKSNPHLKRSFHQIIEGMPLVVSPWKAPHKDEAYAIEQTDELMTEFLTLSSDEKKWFSEHHETTTSALMIIAASNLDTREGVVDSPESSSLNLSHLLAVSAGLIDGAQEQGKILNSKMTNFAEYSKEIAEKTKGISEANLKSNPDYKAWRKASRIFKEEMKGALSGVTKPAYIKEFQARNINKYLNIDKRQLYKAKDFSKSISGIDMTSLYKQSMKFSKGLKIGGVVATGLGLYGNGKDLFQTCITNNDVMSEACGRSTVKNVSSMALNAGMGMYGIGLILSPATGGLSVLLVGGAGFVWGIYGGDISNEFGSAVEEVSFDLYDRLFD